MAAAKKDGGKKKYTTPMPTPNNKASRALTSKRKARQKAEAKDISLITKAGGRRQKKFPNAKRYK